jgi:predicted permease
MDTRTRLSNLAADAGYAWNAVRKGPRLFLFAATMVGIGIGACVTVYSVLSPLLLRPLPVKEADRLVWIANRTGGEGMSAVTSRTSNLRDFRALTRSFEGLTGYNAFFLEQAYNLVGDAPAERLVGVNVAQDFLDVLGVVPALGRSFVVEEGVWGARPVVVLSHSLWQRRFRGDPAVVGTSVQLGNESREIVGVLPASFDFGSVFAPQTRVDFLLPFPISQETDRWGNSLSMVGRLKPGVTVEAAHADLERVLADLRRADPERWGLTGVNTVPLQQQLAGPFRSALLLLAAAAGAVLLVVCVNLSSLLLANAAKRAGEMAVRSALGASRSRLLRQLLLESLLISAAGAVQGLLLASFATQVVSRQQALEMPLLASVTVDRGAFGLASILTLVVGLLVGLVPALQVTRREGRTLREAGRGLSASRGGTRLREGLIVAELALACMLLVFGGLLLKSFRNVLDVDLGFEPNQLVSWQLTPSRAFDTLDAEVAYLDQLVESVRAVPGVEQVGLTDSKPLGRNRTWGIRAPGLTYNGKSDLMAFPHIVDGAYFGVMQIPLLAGRVFTPEDMADRPVVVVLNESAAKAVFQGGEALGQTVEISGTPVRVIGVVPDVRHRSLEDGAGLEMYFALSQIWDFSSIDLMVRSSLPAANLAPSVIAALHRADPSLPTRDYQAFDEVVERAVSPRRFTLSLLTAFSLTALLLAALGIYGVLSFAVSERVREIGIRMALGEAATQVRTKVVGRTLALAGLGLGVGCVGALLLSRSAASLLYGVEPGDPLTLVLAGTLLLAVAAAASWLPARRASRTEIATVLKAS